MCFVHAKNTDSTCAEEKMKECIHFFKSQTWAHLGGGYTCELFYLFL